MKPVERPRTNRPFKQPKDRRSSTSSGENAPHDRSMSTKHTAMQPSTFKIKFARLVVVICSTPHAKSKTGVLPKWFLAKFLMMTTRWSGFASDLIRCPMPMMSLLFFLQLSTKLFGDMPESCASLNILAASSKAPPKRGPMVSKPETRAETRSLPARAVTMALWAPLTAGPWSAVTIKIISMNLQQACGRRFRNQSKESTPPMPKFWLKTSEIVMPPYLSSSPRSSEMEEMKLAGLRTNPNFLAQV
mmetsp:Transcript_658/g.2759  ORF Transcript_658/g.2759 Transcript_658/m.2759 type:complete len:246 (+) Transcript_658:280-1017(+)